MLNTRSIKELVRQYNLGISPRRLGQNFLVAPKMLSRIVDAIGAKPEDRILEIGAGLGALTDELVKTGAHIVAVEKDPRFSRILAERFRDAAQLELVQEDILRTDLAAIALQEPRGLLIVGNIPFSITSPILEFLLHQRTWVRRVVLTVQKEVAQRVVAVPGTKAYSSVSLLVQIAFRPSIAFTIPPNSFYPQPKVTSAVLCLDPLLHPAVPFEQEEAVLKLVRLLFTHRRKTLLNALCIPGIGIPKEEVLERLQRAKIDPIRRPETFHLEELAALQRCLVGP